jgi:hypothetical protein
LDGLVGPTGATGEKGLDGGPGNFDCGSILTLNKLITREVEKGCCVQNACLQSKLDLCKGQLDLGYEQNRATLSAYGSDGPYLSLQNCSGSQMGFLGYGSLQLAKPGFYMHLGEHDCNCINLKDTDWTTDENGKVVSTDDVIGRTALCSTSLTLKRDDGRKIDLCIPLDEGVADTQDTRCYACKERAGLYIRDDVEGYSDSGSSNLTIMDLYMGPYVDGAFVGDDGDVSNLFLTNSYLLFSKQFAAPGERGNIVFDADPTLALQSNLIFLQESGGQNYIQISTKYIGEKFAPVNEEFIDPGIYMGGATSGHYAKIAAGSLLFASTEELLTKAEITEQDTLISVALDGTSPKFLLQDGGNTTSVALSSADTKLIELRKGGGETAQEILTIGINKIEYNGPSATTEGEPQNVIIDFTELEWLEVEVCDNGESVKRKFLSIKAPPATTENTENTEAPPE